MQSKKLDKPKIVTVCELDLEPDEVIVLLAKLGLIECRPTSITPTQLGLDSGIIVPSDGGFGVRLLQTIDRLKGVK